MTQPVDSSILHEIVRVIESRRKVPDKVIVTSKEYLLTYLEDHRRRLEEALMRFDRDRLNMLYGQLASKVKYQLLRRVPARAASAVGLSPAPPAKRPAAPAAKRSAATPPAKRSAAAPSRAQAAKPAKPSKSSKPKPAAKAAKPAAKPAARKKAAVKKAAPAKKKSAAKAKPASRRPVARAQKKAARR